MKKAALSVVLLALTSSMAFAQGCPKPGDHGYLWSVGNILFSKKDGSTAYCTVIGNRPAFRINCTVNENPKGPNSCKLVESPNFGDSGYEDTQYWADINDDGFIDFCREVGNAPSQRFFSCLMGPNFNMERPR
jgi:hypothetical protein